LRERGKSEHHRAGYFLMGSLCEREPAPQKQTAVMVRVKWQSKSLPDSGVSQNARKALSGAMPNREAVFGPGSARSGLLSGRQLKPA